MFDLGIKLAENGKPSEKLSYATSNKILNFINSQSVQFYTPKITSFKLFKNLHFINACITIIDNTTPQRKPIKFV